ncbi:DUF1269 domain-containing protein [Gluconobacter roseus]|uniref:DUF1269 domain-containing protein n=1 Tax=Gluconobacter roseus NBRC 3990 TaxID=1307950 RepID=A0A4Y3M458_9PROT|nr:DUF1269 domain-containing protein [Gluconobacter roseus]KXV42659.1 hypothetical protein AD943_11270 [Gluconobacter roseus]GBR49526.1 hypothetical protein AA3990_2539 [Gluconobacter roseus NBRC 3990]GEB04092.1 hypothetical protein GRO01_16680 [Gluconobacter roseus NBRC 3990]GLP92537.1 hypothetical protein GCM10007871_05150 [Gluconobacter roseus NBRC 3990]
MDTNILVLSFTEQSKAFQAFSELRERAADQKLVVINEAVVERGTTGNITIHDNWANGSSGEQVLNGTLLGSLVGLLLGPLGVLLGASMGALVGSSLSVEDAAIRSSLLAQIASVIPVGTTAVIATVQEYVPQVVDDLAASLGASLVLRRPIEAVEREVLAQQKAQAAAAAEAERVLVQQHSTEWHERMGEWQKQVSTSLHNLKNKITGG